MKVAAVLALAAAAATATPILAERQGAGFPVSCTSQCQTFFPVYNDCIGVAASYTELITCLQPICPPAQWNQLTPCLTCWEAATGNSPTSYWALFMTACS